MLSTPPGRRADAGSMHAFHAAGRRVDGRGAARLRSGAVAVPVAVKNAQAKERMRRYRARKRGGNGALFSAPVAATPSAPSVPAAGGDPFEWIERTLVVPSGPLRGKPFKLGEWQRRFLAAALEPGCREAGLSVARKNGKTGLVSALVLAHLCGPLARPDWRGLVTSLTADLAIELRNAVELTAALSGLQVALLKSPRPGMITGPSGAMVQFLAADKGTGHAKGADLAVIDEGGLMQEPQRAIWNAMLSSTSGRDGRLLVISILGDGPMMSELRARADEDSVRWHGFTTDSTDDPTDPEVWRRANPGIDDGIKSIQYMRDAARRAAVNPADMAAFRAYDLNAPANPDRQLLVTMEQFQAVKRAPAPRRGPCVVGVDLGGSASMTAAAAYWPEVGRMEVHAALPGIPDLHQRALADGVGTRYQRMVDAGCLTVYDGARVTPVQQFLADFLVDIEPVAIVADRYRQSEALDIYAALDIRARLVWRGLGWADASHDVRAFQRAVIDQRLRVGESLVLESAIAESALAIDPAGNAKLDKARSRGRIDAASAAVLACGEAERIMAQPERRGRYRGIAG